MHLRQTVKYSLFIIFVFGYAYGQLNDSSEIIQTVEDIQIFDDSSEVKKTPRYDEEFQRENISEEDKIEQEIENSKDAIQKAQDESAPTDSVEPENIDDEFVERKEVPLKEKSTADMEKTLQENADQKRLDTQPDAQSGSDGFAADNLEESSPITDKPEDISPVEESSVAAPEIQQEEEAVEAIIDEPIDEKPEYERAEREEYVTLPSNLKPLTEAEIERLEKRTNVVIEREPYIQTNKAVESYLKPFKDRRPDWTTQFSLEYTTYEPYYYVSDLNGITAFDFTDYYEASDVPLVQASIDFKRNFGFGAIGLGGSGGYYTTSNNDADLSLIFLSLRAHLYLDNFFNEPYVVPYGTLGWSYIDYTETFDDGTFDNEASGAADNFYFGTGLMFQLDWIDRDSDISSFEMGLQNTFIFVEARMYLDSGLIRTTDDPDLSSDLFVVSGLKLEF